ncbi:hypothetical protein NEOLEDRAFT_1180778 [Neolentinus lepideus HHB14362 ss-1]|uniref:Uncharacterized protein n=1 Tax=Neolentinus lepideus HHB14362 ss-1 TaxID=1314782 RepID=A0A165QK51_9AGAM|nr:hypothetical protein NEOLEDRAFT_1180778 [Neolentinus lepideus HHB14362 ss-1]
MNFICWNYHLENQHRAVHSTIEQLDHLRNAPSHIAYGTWTLVRDRLIEFFGRAEFEAHFPPPPTETTAASHGEDPDITPMPAPSVSPSLVSVSSSPLDAATPDPLAPVPDDVLLSYDLPEFPPGACLAWDGHSEYHRDQFPLRTSRLYSGQFAAWTEAVVIEKVEQLGYRHTAFDCDPGALLTLSVLLLDVGGAAPSKDLVAFCPQLLRWRPRLVNAARRPSSFLDIFLRLSHFLHVHQQLDSSFVLAVHPQTYIDWAPSSAVVRWALDEIEEDIVDLTDDGKIPAPTSLRPHPS